MSENDTRGGPPPRRSGHVARRPGGQTTGTGATGTRTNGTTARSATRRRGTDAPALCARRARSTRSPWS
ncbi:hypothetical protein NKG05_05910 [Oerskovia sp. M15]